VHFLQVARRFTTCERVAFVPAFVAAETSRLLPQVEIVAMPSLGSRTGSILAIFAFGLFSWAARISRLRTCDFFFATSHFLGDTLPAVLVGGKRSAVIVHHIVDPPWRRPGPFFTNFIAYAAEQISLLLVRAFCGVVFVGTPLMKRALEAKGFRQPIVVVGNATETPELSFPARDPNLVTYLGRLSPTKGLEDLLTAWPRVLERTPNARLQILGDGDDAYYEHLARLSQQRNIADSVTFQRVVSDAQKWTAFTTSALFAFASHEEGWGIVLAEAMSAGLPCVTYDLPVFSEVFTDGRIAVPVGDTIAFGDAIAALLGSAQIREELGERALRLGRSFSWDDVAAREISAFERYIQPLIRA
jgi:glycosyltransferase involved in cell wall biosynthesis